jgi:hypothetical protein
VNPPRADLWTFWSAGVRFRFPIDGELMPWFVSLIGHMDSHDERTDSPWRQHNRQVRALLLDAAERRLQGATPQSLNTFEPGMVAPTLEGPFNVVDQHLAAMIIARGDTRIPGQ